MAQFGFYMAGVGIVGAGRAGLLLAWDPNDQGPGAVDEIDFGDIGLYSWIGSLPVVSPALFKMRSKSPIVISAEGCPTALQAEVTFCVQGVLAPHLGNVGLRTLPRS
jgi:hypothetical protein